MEENTHRFSFEIEAEIVAAYRLLENLGPNDIVKRINPKPGNWRTGYSQMVCQEYGWNLVFVTAASLITIVMVFLKSLMMNGNQFY